MPEVVQLKMLSDEGIKEITVPDWETGLKALARVVRVMLPKTGFKLDDETLSKVEMWEQRPHEAKKPFVFFACGGFAVQVRIIPDGA